MRISDSYREQNRRLHQTTDFGSSGHKCAPVVREVVKLMKVKEILDYGCGKQTLGNELKELNVIGYDPCIEGLDEDPEPTDLVVCNDVLEHVEPGMLDEVLEHIRKLTKRRVIFTIHTQPAVKTLPDGRNAHLILQTHIWWLVKLTQYFKLEQYLIRETKEYEDRGFLAIMRTF